MKYCYLPVCLNSFTQQMKRNIYKQIVCGIKNEIKGNCIQQYARSYTSGVPGSGAGKGGGAGGTVRESGGSLGQYGAAQEESYFFKKQMEQLKKLKKKLDSGESLDISQKKDGK